MLLNSSYICALDIGSSKIAAAVAQIRKRRIENLTLEMAPAKGVRHGSIVDSIELTGCISGLMNILRKKSGVNIKYVNVNISGQDITTKHSRAIVPLAERGNKVITLSDVLKASEQARVLGSSLDEEIIHSIPFSYAIDSKKDIASPIGLYSHRLEVDLYLICGKLSAVQSITRAVNQAGFEIKDLFFSGMATSSVLFEKGCHKGGAVLCDIGSDVTELLIFKDGLLKDIRIIPLGGDNITLGLASSLKLPFELAEDVKRSYGLAGDASQIDENKELLVKQNNSYTPIKQRLVAESVTAEARKACQAIKENIQDVAASCRVYNFILAGRTVFLEGFIELLENTLGFPVKIGRLTDPDIAALVSKDSALNGQKYLSYVTALGLIHQALHAEQSPDISRHQITRNPLLKAINKTKEIYQEYF